MRKTACLKLMLFLLPLLCICNKAEAQSKKKRNKAKTKTETPVDPPTDKVPLIISPKETVLKAEKPKRAPQLSMNYEEAITNIQNDLDQRLPKSALERIAIVKSRAVADAQFGYYLRCVEFEIMANAMSGAQTANQQFAWDILNKEIAAANDDEIKAFLYIKAAAALKNNYENRDNNDVINYNDSSLLINEWSGHKINTEINRLIDQGLQLAENIPASNVYDPIIHNNSTNDLPLTVYQVLVKSAIEVLDNLKEPHAINYVAPNKTAALSMASQFLNTPFQSKEDPENEYRILNLYKVLVGTGHLYLDLQRLQYVKSHYSIDEPTYFNALSEFYNKRRSDVYTNLLAYEMASLKAEKEPAKALEIIDLALSEAPDFKDNYLLKNLKYNILKPRLLLTVESHAEPNQKILALLNVANAEKVYIKVYKVAYFKYYNDPLTYNNSEDFQRLLNKLKTMEPPVQSYSIPLPVYKDYLNHKMEIPLEALPAGYYLFVVTNREVIDDSASIIKTAQISVSPATIVEEEKLLKLYNASTGAIMKGEPYTWHQQVWNKDKYEYRQISNGITNNEGQIAIPGIPKNEYSANMIVEVNKQFLYFNKYVYNNRSAIETETQSHLLMTDRSIYRPGQKVNFKCIVYLNKAHTVVPNAKVKVTLVDNNWKEVSVLNLITNSMGSVSGAFTLPQNGFNTGSFHISTEHGIVYFQVEEYKLPKYSVEIDKPGKAYSLNDEVEVTGQARAYAGYPIQEAVVKYTVTRRLKPVYYWGFYKNLSSNYGEIATMASGTTQTDNEGKFKINFNAIPDPGQDKESNPYFIYEVKAIVTDINGEVHEQTRAITLAYTSLQLSVSGSEIFRQGQDIEIYYEARNLQDEIVKFNGEIVLSKITKDKNIKRKRFWEEPDIHLMSALQFRTWFPSYAWNEKETSQEVSRKALINDSNNRWLLSKDLVKEPGNYSVVLTAKDHRGKEIKAGYNFEILQTAEGKYTGAEPLNIYTETGRPTEPGKTLKVMLATAIKDAQIVLKAESKRGVIWSKQVVLNEELKTFELPVTEADRGNIKLFAYALYDYRSYTANSFVEVPYSNKELQVKIASYRNDIEPGSKEKWTLTLKGPLSEKAATEVLAGMYDQALDALNPEQQWRYSFFYSFQKEFNISDEFGPRYFSELMEINDRPLPGIEIVYPVFLENEGLENNFGRRYGRFRISANGMAQAKGGSYKFALMEDKAELAVADSSFSGFNGGGGGTAASGAHNAEIQVAPPVRKNFNETAFFFPHLKTNEKGEIVLEFTAPESLTRWKMKVFAHSTTLQTGYDETQITTSKKLMVQPNLPRFLRQNDEITIASKIVNTTPQSITTKVVFGLKDEVTGTMLNWLSDVSEKTVTVPANGSVSVSFGIKIPAYNGMVNASVVAMAGDNSDGEEHTLPVLSNRMMVTETLPLTVKSAGTQTLEFSHLKNNNSNTLVNHKLTVEMCNNPAWYAVQALPYMLEFPHECAEQTFTRLYANSIVSHLLNQSPEVQKVYAQWEKEAANGGNSLQSKLQKNQDLKTTLIEETPWLEEANAESERMQKLGLLFNTNKVNKELANAWNKLSQMQSPDGGWSWFPGMRGNEYITQVIVIGFGKMKRMGINISGYNESIKNALNFLDRTALDHYQYCKEHKIGNPGNSGLQYLYARSYFVDFNKKNKDSVLDFYIKGAEESWSSNSLLNQAQLAVALKTLKPASEIPAAIIKSFNETAISKPDLGMYWAANSGGCYWYNAPVETQAAIIEAYLQTGSSKESIKEQLVWLMRQKQTQNWKTTRSTADACYALLTNTNFINSGQKVEVSLNNTPVIAEKREAGTGYFRTDIAGSGIVPGSGNITVKSVTSDFAYGAVYWQYFEDYNKIPASGSGLKVIRKLYRVTYSEKGRESVEIKDGDVLKVGDIIEISLTISTDRALEFVHIKDGRASGTEPSEVISSYKYNNGLGYYQSTRDASTNFFADYMQPGTYQLNYSLKAEQAGVFNAGIATVQCMYAPEYSANSTAIVIKIIGDK